MTSNMCHLKDWKRYTVSGNSKVNPFVEGILDIDLWVDLFTRHYERQPSDWNELSEFIRENTDYSDFEEEEDDVE